MLQALTAKGGEVVKEDNVGSSSELAHFWKGLNQLTLSVFPFAVVKLPEEHFHALHNEVQSGHHAVDHVGELLAS